MGSNRTHRVDRIVSSSTKKFKMGIDVEGSQKLVKDLEQRDSKLGGVFLDYLWSVQTKNQKENIP